MSDYVEIEFRDAVRAIPQYVARKLSVLDASDSPYLYSACATLTYADAIKAADKAELNGFVRRAQERIIAGHFRVNKHG